MIKICSILFILALLVGCGKKTETKTVTVTAPVVVDAFEAQCQTFADSIRHSEFVKIEVEEHESEEGGEIEVEKTCVVAYRGYYLSRYSEDDVLEYLEEMEDDEESSDDEESDDEDSDD